MKPRLLFIAYSVLTVVCTISARAAEAAPVDPDHIKIVAEVIGDLPLPFQALRVRVTITNVTDRELGPIPKPTSRPWIRAPDAERFRLPGRIPLRRISLRGIYPGPKRIAEPVLLASNQSFMVSNAFAGEYPDPSLEDRHAIAIFKSTGTYQLEFRYPECAVPNQYARVRLPVTVRRPQNDGDAGILAILKHNPTLADFMMSSIHIPDRESAVIVETILRLQPESSYVEYARYALARAYWDRFGETSPLSTHDVLGRSRAGEIDRYLQAVDDVTIKVGARQIAQFCFHTQRFRDENRELCREVVFAKRRKTLFPERNALILKLVDEETKEHLEQRAEAFRLLESVKSAGFAYRPNVLVFLKELYVYEICRRAADMRLVNRVLNYRGGQALKLALIHARVVKMGEVATRLTNVMDELTSKHSDALVWQYDDGWMSPEEWKALKATVQQRPENFAVPEK